MTQVNLLHLSKTYEGAAAPALRDLSLELASGQITAVLGPSGCGKTFPPGKIWLTPPEQAQPDVTVTDA